MKRLTTITVTAALGLIAQGAYAELTQGQAARLGGEELTPIGAERAGNAAGTIPAWTGGLAELPSGYTEGQPLVDPFPGEQPLFTAAYSDRPAVVRAMLEGGADPESRRDDDLTALMAAAIFGHMDVARVLVEHGADVNARHPWGSTALTIARKNNNAAMVEFLLANGAK